MEDIAPALLEAIRKDFRKILGDAKLKQLDYLGAEEYAETVGDALAKAFRLHISADKLPEGRMFWNIADRVIRPMLELDHKLVADAAAQAQQALNKAAGLGLKAQKAPLDEDKVSGILNKVANAEDFSAVAWVLDEPIRTFSRSVVDDVLRKNIDFQGRAGLRPKVIRTAERKCCRWCSNLAGVYEYPDVPKDVYRRHENCRCSVEYDPGDGKKVQNVHTKKWAETRDYRISKNEKFSQYYRPLNRNANKPRENFTTKNTVIRAVKVNLGRDQFYISDNAVIKPRAAHIIHKNTEDALRYYGIPIDRAPRIVIASEQELFGALGKYDVESHVVYLVPAIADKNVVQKYGGIGAVEFHEMCHVRQAEDFRKSQHSITIENRGNYIKELCSICKKNLDSQGVTEYNVNEISKYAADMYSLGRYDETEAELMTMRRRR